MTGRPVSVVTGATGGIGSAFARALAKLGHNVIMVGTSPEKLAATRASLLPGPHLEAPLDVASPDDMNALTEMVQARYGRVDALVASAGIGRSRDRAGVLPCATKDLPLSEWNAVLDVNLTGAFLSNMAVLPLMRAAGRGRIVNIGSSTTPHGLRGRPLAPAYSASKFAMLHYTRALAAEVAPLGIQAIAILPGSVETPLVAGTLLDAPFGGKMDAENFASAVLHLMMLGEDIELPDPHILPMPTPMRTGELEERSS